MRTSLAALVGFVVSCSHPQPRPASPQAHDRGGRGWIERSNQNAQLLLQVQAKFQPEFAARQGIMGLDDRISDFTPGHLQRLRDATRQVQTELENRLAAAAFERWQQSCHLPASAKSSKPPKKRVIRQRLLPSPTI
jgi:hypothetical protein